MFIYSLNPIQEVDRRIKLAINLMELLRYHAIWFHGNNFTSVTFKFKFGKSFSDHANSIKNESVSIVLRIPMNTC